MLGSTLDEGEAEMPTYDADYYFEKEDTEPCRQVVITASDVDDAAEQAQQGMREAEKRVDVTPRAEGADGLSAGFKLDQSKLG
jgi:hypothetical protein